MDMYGSNRLCIKTNDSEDNKEERGRGARVLSERRDTYKAQEAQQTRTYSRQSCRYGATTYE